MLFKIHRVDLENKRYVGALCGLGFDKVQKKPIFTENDIENAFECTFDQEDMKTVSDF